MTWLTPAIAGIAAAIAFMTVRTDMTIDALVMDPLRKKGLVG
jgi:hypothetical protein